MINKKISIIMPVFNEEKNVVVAYNKINDFFISQLKNFEY
jgi:glycosyltransferase involved in cell wall biosynthesis